MNRSKLTVTTVFAVAGFVLCAWLSPGFGFPASAAVQAGKVEAPLKLGEEHSPVGEDATIKALVELQVAIMKKGDPAKRGQHPKHHGCVEAEFVIRGDIPKEYQLGIFKDAKKSYKAKVRFSNGSQKDDREKDIHGMAIMVLGVKGKRAVEDGREDQDFVLIDSETFFAPDAKTVLDLMKHMDAAKDPVEGLKKFGQNDFFTALRIVSSMKTLPSPLTVQYWSTVPFKLGDRAVKYTAKPAAGNGPKDARPKDAKPKEDYLRAAMVDHLTTAEKAAVFDLHIIPQTDPVKMPVEDPTVRWQSESVPVATIKIAPQTFDTAERMKECEKASFDPWHALAEHRPLGGVNRARKAVYAASVKVRQP